MREGRCANVAKNIYLGTSYFRGVFENVTRSIRAVLVRSGCVRHEYWQVAESKGGCGAAELDLTQPLPHWEYTHFLKFQLLPISGREEE